MSQPYSKLRGAASVGSLGVALAALLCASCASHPSPPQAAVSPKTPMPTVPHSSNKITARLSTETLPSAASSNLKISSSSTQPATSIPAAVAERSIGSVRMVGAAQRFVLIEIPWNVSNMLLDNGLELRCRAPVAQGGAQTALLRVGRERRQQFVVADVLSGRPSIGDGVFLAADHASAAPSAPAIPSAPLLPTIIPGNGVLFPPPAAALRHP